MSRAGGPLVSIVMTSYNYGKYIRQAIQSVLDQAYTNWELIINDDGSTYNSVELIRSFHDDRIFFLGSNPQGSRIPRGEEIRWGGRIGRGFVT